MFSRIAIVNRGEAAMRLIHAVRDLNAQTGDGHRSRRSRCTPRASARAMFVREADLAYDLGPGLGAALPRPTPCSSGRCVETGADAAWVGWGFVAEDPAFAELCERHRRHLHRSERRGDAQARRQDRLQADRRGGRRARRAVEPRRRRHPRGRAGRGRARSATRSCSRRPPAVAAAASGWSPPTPTSTDAYERTRDEAQRAFGSGVVFLERLVTGARHVEVQVIADGQGTAWALGVRDCSVQRRNQKVIEESASPVLDAEQADELKASRRAARPRRRVRRRRHRRVPLPPGRASSSPSSRSTPGSRSSTRSPRSPPTSTWSRLQIHVAAGGRLEGDAAGRDAATPSRPGSTPRTPTATSPRRPGRIALLDLPAGPGIRVDTGVGEGDTIPADFDSMIAKIIAYGRTRDEALARLRRAMAETTVVIEGGADQQELHPRPARPARGHRRHAPTPAGSTGSAARAGSSSHRHSGIALVAAGIEAYEDEEQRRAHPAARDRPRRPAAGAAPGRPGRSTSSCAARRTRSPCCAPARTGSGSRRRRRRPRRPSTPSSTGSTTYASRLIVGGRASPPGHRHPRPGPPRRGRRRHPPGQPRRGRRAALARAGAGRRHPGRRRRRGRGRRAGARAREHEDGDGAARAVRRRGSRSCWSSTGSQVETGAPLVRLEPRRRRRRRRGGAPTRRRRPRPARAPTRTASAGRSGPSAGCADLRRDAARLRRRPAATRARTLAGYLAARDELARRRATSGRPTSSTLLERLRRLRRAEPQPAGRRGAAHRATGCTARASTSTPTCRASTSSAAALPERVPRPAGPGARGTTASTTWTARPSWRRRCSGSSWPSSARPPTSRSPPPLLQRWIAEPPPDGAARRGRPATCSTGWSSPPSCASRSSATWPAASGSAGSTSRWSTPSAPSVLAGVRDEVAALAADAGRRRPRRSGSTRWPPSPSRSCGSSPSGSSDGVPEREPMLEVLIRRHYREYDLHDLRVARRRRPPVRGRRLHPRRPADPPGLDRRHGRRAGRPGQRRWSPRVDRRRSTAARAGHESGRRPLPALARRARRTPTRPATQLARAARRRSPFAHDVRRVAVAVCAGGDRPVGYFTFRPDRRRRRWSRTTWSAACTRWSGRRLNLWRLRDFDVTRLEAPEDVLLYDCVARENPADQRLVALAQVRQLAVVRDEDGTVTVAAARRAGGRELPGGDPPGPRRLAAPPAPSST